MPSVFTLEGPRNPVQLMRSVSGVPGPGLAHALRGGVLGSGLGGDNAFVSWLRRQNPVIGAIVPLGLSLGVGFVISAIVLKVADRSAKSPTTSSGAVAGTRGRRRGLAGRQDADEAAAYELRVYIDNDEPLWRQKNLIRANLAKKVCRGDFDSKLAPKGFRHVVDAAAKKYAKEFDDASRWNSLFAVPTRDATAADLASDFKNHVNMCIKDGHCGDAPAELKRCPTARPLSGRGGKRRR